LLAHPPAVGRAALAVEVALQAMADGFVQQHSRPARAHHHRHAAGGCGDGIEVDDSLAYRLAGVGHGPFLGLEEAVVGTPATTEAAAFAAPVVLDDDTHVQTHQRTDIPGPGAVTGCDQYGVVHTAEADGDLRDARIEAAGVGVQALQKTHLVGLGHAVQRVVRGVQRRVVATLPGLDCALLAAAGDRARSASGLVQRVQAQVVAVGEAGL